MLFSQVLSGGSSGPTPNAKDPDRVDVTKGAASAEDAIAAMNRMLQMG